MSKLVLALTIGLALTTGCGGAPRLAAGLAGDAALGNLGVHAAPIDLPGIFGGPVAAPTDARCVGYFSAPPDVVLRPTDVSLHVHLESPDEASLLVRDGSGTWRCADERTLTVSAEDARGAVRIWVGGRAPDALVEGRLRVETR